MHSLLYLAIDLFHDEKISTLKSVCIIRILPPSMPASAKGDTAYQRLALVVKVLPIL